MDTLLAIGLLGVIAYMFIKANNDNAQTDSGSVSDATGTTEELGLDVGGIPSVPDLSAAPPDTSAPAQSSLDIFKKWATAIQNWEGGNPWNRNMRNNNPGNLKGTDFTGQTGTDAGGFAIFATLQDGVNALIADLRAVVQKYPDFSLLQFETHYLGGNPYDLPAPGQPVVLNGVIQGNPYDYSKFVAGRLGVSPTDTLQNIFGG